MPGVAARPGMYQTADEQRQAAASMVACPHTGPAAGSPPAPRSRRHTARGQPDGLPVHVRRDRQYGWYCPERGPPRCSGQRGPTSRTATARHLAATPTSRSWSAPTPGWPRRDHPPRVGGGGGPDQAPHTTAWSHVERTGDGTGARWSARGGGGHRHAATRRATGSVEHAGYGPGEDDSRAAGQRRHHLTTASRPPPRWRACTAVGLKNAIGIALPGPPPAR